jgi:ubiquitin-conjugating enzyme E2 variant
MGGHADANRERVAGGYSGGQRAFETACVIAFFAGEALLLRHLLQIDMTVLFAVTGILAFIFSALLSDLVSGTVHWACDTWGTINTPFMGRLFIRQFREHHSDAEEITRHDFVETNGTNAFLALIPISISYAMPWDPENPSLFVWIFDIVGFGLALFTTFTSQAHKWAHTEKVPSYVHIMQKMRIVLSKEHHAVHHQPPHRHHYSITGGWVDRWLERYSVFRRLEAAITRLTGAKVQA